MSKTAKQSAMHSIWAALSKSAVLLLTIAAVILCSCSQIETYTATETHTLYKTETVTVTQMTTNDANEEQVIYAKIGTEKLTIKLENNSSAKAFYELLKKSDLSIEMHHYGGFEIVGDLGSDLPRNDMSITTEPGDVILYQGNSVTIYYDRNTWSFTRLGKIQGVTQQELKDIIGNSNPTVVFSLS